MNDLVEDSNVSYPVAIWTWHDGKGGRFSTQIFGNGQICQQRRHREEDAASPQTLGVLPASQAAALLTHCRDAVGGEPSHFATELQATPERETYRIEFADSGHPPRSREVERSALSSDAAMENTRREVLAVRHQVYRRWNIWTSAGARWFFLTMAVTLALGLYIVWDIRHDSELQSRSRNQSGIVLEQGGTPFKSEYLVVRLSGEQATTDVRISKYLSHPNWEAAKAGTSVNVVYDVGSGQGWLAADLLRWQRDKKTIWVLPGFLALVALIGLAWLRRYQIGVYGNGEEYMIYEDRVVTDDKDAAISRSLLLWFKMFV